MIEKSLENIDTEITKMKRKIHRIDEEIIESVSKQSRAGARGRHQLEESRTSIKDLFTKIQEIKGKASNSERMVNDICSDIRDLDHAKRNLSATTRALSNLQTIVIEMERLKTMTEKRNYSEVANLTEAVKEILRLFADWKDIDRVKELQAAFDSIKRVIKAQVFNEFEHVDANKMSRDQLNNLMDACFVIDAMGEEVRREFIDKWTERQLGVYELQFKSGAEASQLGNVDKRYQWLLTWIAHYEEHFSKVFPIHWRVSEAVAFQFCLITNGKMLEMLEKTKSTLKVNALKTALKNTLNFETALANYFSKQVALIPAEDLEKELHSDGPRPASTSSSKLDANSAAIIAKMQPPKKESLPFEEIVAQVMQKFKGVISMCFEAYMYLYVEHQQTLVHSRFNDLLQTETWTVEEAAQSKVFGSARALFDTLSKVRERVSNLNQSQAFFEIYAIFKRYLSEYADRLKLKLDAADLAAQRIGSSNDEILCCVMINTGEYCGTMAATIQKVIQSEISVKFKSQVDLEPERAKFALLIARSREILTKLIAIAIDPAFIEMSRTNWDRFVADGSVFDASNYVSVLGDYIADRVPVFRKYIMDTNVFKTDLSEIGPNYFQIICDSILAYVTKRFEQALRACKRIAESGAQQLVTDLAQIKKILESLPTLQIVQTNEPQSSSSSSSSSSATTSNKATSINAPAAYLKKVRREVETIEKMLKVIWTPSDMLVDTYKALLPNHSDADFVAIMQLKGVPYAEQHVLLDVYGTPKDSPTRDLVTRDWVNSSKNALETTTQTVKNLLNLNMFNKD
jgi:DNA-binding FrmR family transcriptional regulator